MSDLYTPVVDSLSTVGIDGRHVKKRIGEIAALDAFAAKRVADDLEALILEVDTSALLGISEWPGSKGFDVLPEALEAGSAGRTRLHLQLAEKTYREVFLALCRDVCGVMAEASRESEAIRVFHQRLVRWQSFLQKHGPEGLSEQARCGLFGELLVLRDLLLPSIEARTALRAWRGCKKAHQDFQFPDRALEVKTTRAVIPDRISVSNVQQLDGEGMQHMFLTVVHVHESDTAGETLPDLVNGLRATFSDDVKDILDEGLEEVGYSDAHESLYTRRRYLLMDLLHFEIRTGFPRLTRHEIPEGVKSVKYEITVDACRPFRTDQAAVLQVLQEGLKDGVNG